MGPESSVIYYNLNKQYSNIRKVVITPEILFGSFENDEIKTLFENLSKVSSEEYMVKVKEALETDALNSYIKNEFYQKVQESLNKVVNNMMDIQLKDYNFMNSVSNSKFTVTLRCDNFSLSKYYVEKGTILTSIRNLLKEYLSFEGNMFRISRLMNFQVEIFEGDEYYKRVILKKDGSSLILASDYGFPRSSPIDYNSGSELYYSMGESFNFYKNCQTHAIFREHAKLVEEELNPQEKILSNDDLMNINKETKDINDAVVEIFMNKKGNIKIVHVSLLENKVEDGNENGFVINKSEKNYNKISIVTLRDNLEDELSNPKYLLIRNQNEIKELMGQLSILKSVDGVIFNQNVYMPLLDKIGQVLDMDIVFYKEPVKKALEVDVDFKNLNIVQEEVKSESFNPFSNIISEETNKNKDEFLERLKNLDLNDKSNNGSSDGIQEGMGSSFSNSQSGNGNNGGFDRGSVSNIAESIISSPNSSMNKGGSNNNGSSTMDFGNNGGKKSAIGMLAEAVMQNDAKPVQDENVSQSPPQGGSSMPQQQGFDNGGFGGNNDNNSNNMNNFSNNNGFDNSNSGFDNVNNMNNGVNSGGGFNNEGQQNANLNSSQNSTDFSAGLNSFEGFGESSNSANSNNQTKSVNTTSSTSSESSVVSNSERNFDKSKVDVAKYDAVVATKIITSPNVDSGAYFVDMNNLGLVNGGDIYFSTSSKDNISNPNLKYVLPLRMYSEDLKKHYFMIGGVADLFSVDLQDFSDDVNLFVNMSEMEGSVKENFLKFVCSKFRNVSLIANRKDLDVIGNHIEKITAIFVKDINSSEDYDSVKNSILSFEKNYVMKNL